MKMNKAMMLRDKAFLSEDGSAMTQTACLTRIYKKINEGGYSAEAVEELRADLDYISSVYKTDAEGVVLMAAILEQSVSNRCAAPADLAIYLGCSNIEFLRFHGTIDGMERAGIINVSYCCDGQLKYRITPEVRSAVERNGAFRPVRLSGLTSDELFSQFKRHFQEFHHGNMDSGQLLDRLHGLVAGNEQLDFCRKVLGADFYTEVSATEVRIFYCLCFHYAMCGEQSVDISFLAGLCDPFEDEDRMRRRLSGGRTRLQEMGVVGFAVEDGFVNTGALSLSDEVRAEYFTEVDVPSEEPLRHRDIISASTIQPRELFYNAEEGAQISRLEHLLEENAFRGVQERLQATGMRRGFNAIFYGAPGTGKTASVYELARRSGRDIFRVDMAKLKSKWVGESEKTVRSVFKMYRSLCTDGKKAPILLFNEADAIFTRRIENIEHSVDQMNNAIQNIILEEMESIEGILIATTNLLSNLDPAFERRFLFKVEFKVPGRDSRAKIWRSMIPGLTETEADTLAGRYDFSGGNIENVARKSTVEYVLSGSEPTVDTIDGYCREEILRRTGKTSRIGF